MRAIPPARFLVIAGGCFVAFFAVVWLWVWLMPLAFLDPEYPFWRAKQALLAACDLGDVMVLGDSRAATGMMPADWPVRATNLAVGGGEAIEALAVLTRAAHCPKPPKLVVLSLDAVHFTHPDLFWERTVRFGFLDPADIAQLREVSARLGDPSVYEIRHTDGLPSWMRDAMYQARFPPLYFASLVKGGLLLRWSANQKELAAGLAARGHYFFGTAAGSASVAAEGHLRAFRPLPVLAWYFDQVLSQLAARGIPAVFVAMPMNEPTARAVDPAVRRAFRAWLVSREQRYPGFHVVGDVMPHWPDRFFGDGFAHLNPEGAARFSEGFSQCLTGDSVSATCVLRLQAPPAITRTGACTSCGPREPTQPSSAGASGAGVDPDDSRAIRSSS